MVFADKSFIKKLVKETSFLAFVNYDEWILFH